MYNKLYKITNLILKIKSIALVVLSFIGIIFSIIFICNGNQLIKDSEQITNDASGTIQCSTALSGGILKILGIILLFVAIIMLIKGMLYLLFTRKMKNQVGKKKSATITLFVFELVSLVINIVVLIIHSVSGQELLIILISSLSIIQCCATSILLGKLLTVNNMDLGAQ